MPRSPITLDSPLLELRGVGPERAGQLARLELRTIGDLLLHAPARYEDRRHFLSIAKIPMKEAVLTQGKIVAAGVKSARKGRLTVFEFLLDDGTGRLHCRWWNQPYQEKRFAVGDEVVVYGKAVGLKPRTMDHPETEIVSGDGTENSVHLHRIVPVYPLTEGLPQRWLRALLWRVIEQFGPGVAEPQPGANLALEPIPGWDLHFPTRANALRMLHFPEAMSDTTLARERLAMDEFVALQIGIQVRRKRLEARARPIPCAGDHNRLIRPFLAGLGFDLTESQAKVLREIRRDLGGAAPMRRLLQGDVGSGKTVVAACAILMALESGANAALMAPTEILAAQHWQNFRRWLEPLGVAVEMRTGSYKSPERGGLLRGPVLSIGTHALLEEAFAPERLGLVIIDEQHKFGVGQREQLVRKGSYPHLLVMTATPIPRTLGLTVYGDLDLSVIEKPPPGRGLVKTFVRTVESLPKVWEFVRGQLGAGRQGYVVYSRVEDADTSAGVKAATREFHHLQKTFAPFRVELLHGQMRSAEKERAMEEFRRNRANLLLATSVIEVGVDVPNATVMVIENAEQFGLAQLHQLRGRIGRGAKESFCILIGAEKTEEARARLKIMEETSDGFKIAEEDLRLRGAGEFLGQRQSGDTPMKFGDLARDGLLVERARALVKEKLLVGRES